MKIVLKHSLEPGKVPQLSDLEYGELAVNYADGKLYYKRSDDTIHPVSGSNIVAYVTNAETVTITKGQAVYLFSAQGDRATVKLASNTGDATSAKTFGIATQSIAAGQSGYVMCWGVLDGLNLASYTPGDTLYLGSSPGSLTATKPVAPNHMVYIGIVERANAGSGQLYIKIQNGYELNEIHDVLVSNPVNRQALIYDSATGLWKNSGIVWDDIGNKPAFGTISLQNANNVTITGGTASLTSAIVGNLSISNNEITSTELAGDVLITPTGTGAAKVQNRLAVQDRVSIGSGIASDSYLATNAYFFQLGELNTWFYSQPGPASKVAFQDGSALAISTAPNSTSGDEIVLWDEIFKIDNSGNVTLGNWQAAIISSAYGGTGVDNNGNTLTITANATISGTNTGDQTITLTGDVTGSGASSFTTTLANTAVTPGLYGSATQVAQITFDSKGRAIAASNVDISPQWRLEWQYLLSQWSTEPAEVGSATVGSTPGSVYSYTLGTVTRYRFVPTVYSPSLDSFYTTYSAGTLSGLICSRG